MEKGKAMNILLAAVNAKYIHSNPAVFSLRAFAKEYAGAIQIGEYTINHRIDDILADIYKRKPDVIAFSCYIWNLPYVEALMENLRKILPKTAIWAGGPEVSYDAKRFLEQHPAADGIMRGEGERTFLELARYYIAGKGRLDQIPGITWRGEEGIQEQPIGRLLPMDEIPFLYEDLNEFSNRIIYYESSRGCPFSCSYCLSSIDRSVRFRSLSLVEKELQFFLDRKVLQVKFVDRTFNCNHEHAMGIWNYIKEHDNGVTNFHFEIAADILREEELELLSTFRPGLVQLEIGVQSTNAEVIREIDRVMEVAVLEMTVERIRAGKNIHQHLDLIAGLPLEDYESFRESFNRVYGMKPEQLQLGFLKVLKGSKMQRNAEEYGIVYRQQPPYEVLFSKWISYEEIQKLKAVEEMVEVYYNSHQFAHTIGRLVQRFQTPFDLYEALARYYGEQGLNGQCHSRMARLEILRKFAAHVDQERIRLYEELLLLDLYLRENSKSRPSWADDLGQFKEQTARFYQEEAANPGLLTGYEGYHYRQLRTMTHIEAFSQDVLGVGMARGYLVVFDYKTRDKLTGDAAWHILPAEQERR